jgi:site-specific DNA-cytosine methylase
VEGSSLGNWVHEQRKKFKRGHLTADRINLLFDLQFEFLTQANVVGAKLTAGVAISSIFKYKKRKLKQIQFQIKILTNSSIVGLPKQRMRQRKLSKKGWGIQTLHCRT